MGAVGELPVPWEGSMWAALWDRQALPPSPSLSLPLSVRLSCSGHCGGWVCRPGPLRPTPHPPALLAPQPGCPFRASVSVACAGCTQDAGIMAPAVPVFREPPAPPSEGQCVFEVCRIHRHLLV